MYVRILPPQTLGVSTLIVAPTRVTNTMSRCSATGKQENGRVPFAWEQRPFHFVGKSPFDLGLVSTAVYPIRGNRHITLSQKTYEIHMWSGGSTRAMEGPRYTDRREVKE